MILQSLCLSVCNNCSRFLSYTEGFSKRICDKHLLEQNRKVGKKKSNLLVSMHMCGISSNAFELNVHCDRGDSIVLVLSAPSL